MPLVEARGGISRPGTYTTQDACVCYVCRAYCSLSMLKDAEEGRSLHVEKAFFEPVVESVEKYGGHKIPAYRSILKLHCMETFRASRECCLKMCQMACFKIPDNWIFTIIIRFILREKNDEPLYLKLIYQKVVSLKVLLF